VFYVRFCSSAEQTAVEVAIARIRGVTAVNVRDIMPKDMIPDDLPRDGKIVEMWINTTRLNESGRKSRIKAVKKEAAESAGTVAKRHHEQRRSDRRSNSRGYTPPRMSAGHSRRTYH
jgi:hypothetical protein